METTLDKMTIQELIKRSGFNKNTFYYHFTDKYNLVITAFQYGVYDSCGKGIFQLTSSDFPAFAAHLVNNRKFYLKIIDSIHGQLFKEFLHNVYEEAITKEVDLVVAGYPDREKRSEKAHFLVSYFTSACFYSVLKAIEFESKVSDDADMRAEFYLLKKNMTHDLIRISIEKFT